MPTAPTNEYGDFTPAEQAARAVKYKAPKNASELEFHPTLTPIQQNYLRVQSMFPTYSHDEHVAMATAYTKQDKATNMMLQGERIKDIFSFVSDETASAGPETVGYAGITKQDLSLSKWVSESHDFMLSLYGSDSATAVTETYIIPNDVSAQKSRDIILKVAGMDFTGPNIMAGEQVPKADQAETWDLLSNIIASDNPTAAFKALTPLQQFAVHQVATTASEQATALSGSITRGMKVLKSGDYSAVLSESDLNRVKEILALGDTMHLGRTDDLEKYKAALQIKNYANGNGDVGEEAMLNHMIGIDQIRSIDGGILVLDKAWAQTHPDKAAALHVFLEQEFPDVHIEVGRDGVFGSFQDSLGRGIDHVAAPFVAAGHQYSEWIEAAGMTPEKRQANQAALDKVNAQIENYAEPNATQMREGTYVPMEELLHERARLEEDLTSDLGRAGFDASVGEVLSSRIPGFGAGELFTQSMGIMPGDKGHDAILMGASMAIQVAADPTTWILPVLGGWKAAKGAVMIPRTVEEVTSLEHALELERGIEAARAAAGESILSSEKLTSVVNRTIAREVSLVRKFGGIPPEIGGLVRQKVFNRFVLTPDEMAATEAWQESFNYVYDIINSPAKEEVVTGLERVYGRDQAQRMLSATSRADLQDIMIRNMSGRYVGNGTTVSRLALEEKSLTKQIRALKRDDTGRLWSERIAEIQDRIEEVQHGPAHPYIEDELHVLDDELETATKAQAKYLDEHLDLRARRIHVHDILNRGADFDVPVAIPTAKDVKYLRKLHGDVTGVQEEIVRDAMTPGPMTAKRATLYRKAFQNLGFGDTIAMEGRDVHASIESLEKLGTFLGIPERRMRVLLAPMADKSLDGDIAAQFSFREELFYTMLDEANIPGTMKESFKHYYESYEGPRGAAFISEDGQVNPVPAMYNKTQWEAEEAARAAGQTVDRKPMYGLPIIEADEIKALEFHLPTLQDWFSEFGYAQRHLKSMAAASGKFTGGITRLTGRGLAMLGRGFDIWNELFKAGVMIPRLPAMALRLAGEGMARIWGYHYATLFSHPADWFRAFGAVARRSTDEGLLVAGMEMEDLGSIIDNAFSESVSAGTTGLIKQGDKSYPAAVSKRLAEWYQSHSLAGWHLDNLGDVDATLAVMRDEKNLWRSQKFLDRYAGAGYTAEEGVAIAQRDLLELLGEGPAAEKIKASLITGKAKVADGTVHKIGSVEYSEWLAGMLEDGTWKPTKIWIPGQSTQTLRYARESGLRNMRDWFMDRFYTKPDLAITRSNLARQVAKRELRNLLAAGYDMEAALPLAKQAAAGRTADIMFTIGAHTTGEHFLKTFSPFFPASRELADTWLLRVPKVQGEIGGVLGWGLGAAKLTRRAVIFEQAAAGTGFIKRDEEGNLVVPTPFIAGAINLLTGADVNFLPEFDLTSLAGVFPFPAKLFRNDPSLSAGDRLFGAAPSLGAPATLTLGAVDKALGNPGWLQSVEDFVAPYGLDPSGVASSVEDFLAAGGWTPPWVNASAKSFIETMETSSILDGMRIYTRDNPPPRYPDDWEDITGEERRRWITTVLEPWQAAAIAYGNKYKTRNYIAKGLGGTILPFSLHWTDEGAKDLADMWATLKPFEGLPDEDRLTSAVIKTFMADHPNLKAYMTSKYLDTRTSFNSDEDFSSWVQDVKDGNFKVRSPEDYSAFLIGKSNINFLHRRIEAVDAKIQATDNPMMTYLTNKKLRRERDEAKWALYNYEDYMSTEESRLPGQTRPFMSLYNEDQANRSKRAGDDPFDLQSSLSLRNKKLLDFDGMRQQFDKLITLDPAESSHYYKKLGRVWKSVSDLFSSEDDPFMDAVTHYYTKINTPYWEHATPLYDSVDTTEPEDRPIIYNKIRNLANRNAQREHWNGYEFPTPEEYSFALKSKVQQDNAIADWAALKPEWLTQFQRNQVGYPVPPKKEAAANKLSDIAFQADQTYHAYLTKNDLSSNSRDGLAAKARTEAYVAEQATKLGLSKYWANANRPNYIKIGEALHLGQRTEKWNIISKWATDLRNQIHAAGYEPQSASGDMQQQAYTWFINNVNALHDPELDAILTNLADALGSGGHPLSPDQLLEHLFFDMYVP